MPTDDELAKVYNYLKSTGDWLETLDPDEFDNLDEAAQEAYKLAALVDPKRPGRFVTREPEPSRRDLTACTLCEGYAKVEDSEGRDVRCRKCGGSGLANPLTGGYHHRAM